MGFNSPKAPGVPMPPPSAHPPVLGSALSGNDQIKDQGEAAEGLGADGTIKTSPQGLQTTPTLAKATLLGQ